MAWDINADKWEGMVNSFPVYESVEKPGEARLSTQRCEIRLTHLINWNGATISLIRSEMRMAESALVLYDPSVLMKSYPNLIKIVTVDGVGRTTRVQY